MTNLSLAEHYQQSRRQSLSICEPLVIEDYGLQAADFVSPPKWHLAHTSWFYETFLLQPYVDGYRSPNRQFAVLFNSYYNGIGEQFPRPQRGLLSRPTVDEVMGYRSHVDQAMMRLLTDNTHPESNAIQRRTRLGIEHEQQHQELLYTDLLYSLSANPLYPTYSHAAETNQSAQPAKFQWREFSGGLITIGLIRLLIAAQGLPLIMKAHCTRLLWRPSHWPTG
ncbi:DinB family protein [Oceanicoccus sp. KOV_DT_Chl]|uniref:DinB family protein n=1 Tax=Oceanicoccus sp. KOV_DT_Chl TaxID=1904639 RepID=UPI001F1E678B|nr:DinB family protein [Oceanicoccus sp. KOV_DT_Chl]